LSEVKGNCGRKERGDRGRKGKEKLPNRKSSNLQGKVFKAGSLMGRGRGVERNP